MFEYFLTANFSAKSQLIAGTGESAKEFVGNETASSKSVL
jgi:hypothetical protein